MLEKSREIFISYAWGGNSEEFVNRLDRAFQEKGIAIIRDKRDLGYKGLIKEFMEHIGRGKYVIAVINDKYLKSPNCMFELVQVSKNGEFYERIFPIVLPDAQIYDPVQRLKYIKHWEEKKKELNEAIREVGAEYLQGIREEIDQYTQIRNTIAELTSILKNMNTLTPDIHQESDFNTLFQAIDCKLTETLEEDDVKNVTSGSQKRIDSSSSDDSSWPFIDTNSARLVVVTGDDVGKTFPLNRLRMIVGRASTADVQLLSERMASRSHFAIVWDSDTETHSVEEWGHPNRIRLNNSFIEKRARTELKPGDEIKLGGTILRYENG